MAQKSPFNLQQAMQEAVALHQRGRLREAEKLYARVLKVAPEHSDALQLLGLAKAQGGQMGEAFRLMSAALKINPKAPDVLMNLANVLHALKRDARRSIASTRRWRCGRAIRMPCTIAATRCSLLGARRTRSPASMRCWRAIRAMPTPCSIAAARSQR